MINVLERKSSQTSARMRINLSLRFAERRLLLLAGDALVISVSAFAAVWIHSLL